MDPWDTRHVKTLPQEDGSIVQIQVQYGGATAVQFDPTTQSVGTIEVHSSDLLDIGFPKDALDPPVGTDAWEQRRNWDGRQVLLPLDPECPRRGDGHLSRAIIEVLETLGKDSLVHRAINIGGMYGAGTPDTPDDPIVEAVRWDSNMQVLCIGCQEFKAIERLAGHLQQVHVSPMAASVGTRFAEIPAEWTTPDILRVESMPGGTSCLVLRSVLKVVRPTLVVLIVHGQIPPPIRFSTLRESTNPDVTGAFYSCSVAAVSAILEVHGLSLLRMSGPYALFVRRDVWKQSQLPLDATECFRHVEAWGADIFPISVVRSWLFNPNLAEVVASMHGNISAAFASFGLAGEPFMLSW